MTPVHLIKPNPNNPRIIRDAKFRKLVASIEAFPEMLSARPLICTPDMVVLGGNMRLKAIQELGIKEVPVTIVDWEEAKQREFIIKDNVSYGEWNWDTLANEWDTAELNEWGLDLWEAQDEDQDEPPARGGASIVVKFEDEEHLGKAENEIQELIDRMFPGAYLKVQNGK
jgi:ParB-like chromosome segregation protein Spo0J